MLSSNQGAEPSSAPSGIRRIRQACTACRYVRSILQLIPTSLVFNASQCIPPTPPPRDPPASDTH